MKTQIIALESHDDFISVRDRMSWAKSPRILLVWPKFEKVSLRAADLRILQQHAHYLGADLGLVTRRNDVKRDAERFGIPVFASAAVAQKQAWPEKRPLKASKLPEARQARTTLQMMGEQARVREEHWKSTPVARVGFFALGVLAVIAIASLFVPYAEIRLSPLSEEQHIALPVTASKSVTSVSITGNVPVHEISATVSGTQSARVTSQSPIPQDKASGIIRFRNLTQSEVAIPAGTIVYSVSPAEVRFATLNDTHLAGNVNAVVEVPIAAVNPGEPGNLPANSIQAIGGNLSLSASVTNPASTTGGADRVTTVPSEADRKRVRDVLVGVLQSQAEKQIGSSIGSKDFLLTNTVTMGQVLEETYDPPAGQPGNLLKLSLRADFSAQYVTYDDLMQLSEATLNAGIPQGFVAVPNTMVFHAGTAQNSGNSGASQFDLEVERKLVRQIDLLQAKSLARGVTPQAAAQALQASLPLAGPPVIDLQPAWWPSLPLIPFRITVVSSQ
jgi:hypothetical protein